MAPVQRLNSSTQRGLQPVILRGSRLRLIRRITQQHKTARRWVGQAMRFQPGKQRRDLRNIADDPDKLPEIYADLINTAISGRPADMRMTMHLCRGNFRSMWIAINYTSPSNKPSP